jgi:hypothetical protein
MNVCCPIVPSSACLHRVCERSGQMRLLRRIVIVLATIVPAVISTTALSTAIPPIGNFNAAQDTTTGKMVYTLTSSTDSDNYVLDSGLGNWNAANDTLVYRNVDASGSISYYSVNLDTAATPVQFTISGHAKGGSVYGGFLYAYYATAANGTYTEVRKFDITKPGDPVSLNCPLSNSSWYPKGDITISSDGNWLIYLQTNGTYTQAYKCNLNGQSSNNSTIIVNTNTDVDRFRFSPNLADATRYSYVNKSYSKLAVLGVGDISVMQNSALHSTNPTLNGYTALPNLFYTSDGRLWSNATDSTGNQLIVNYQVSFTSGNVGSVTAFTPIPNSVWQGNFAQGQSANWMVGDGQDTNGTNYIHKLLVDTQAGTVTQIRLAQASGTVANAHFLPARNVVTWTAISNGHNQVFAVPISLSAKFWSAIDVDPNDSTHTKTVYQLSVSPGNHQYDNFGFYYHTNNFDGGKYLVYREVISGYPIGFFRVDLNSGDVAALTPSGEANGGFVRGDYLYAFSSGESPTSIKRYQVSSASLPAQGQVLCSLTNSSWAQSGDVQVNADASSLMYLELNSSLVSAANKCDLTAVLPSAPTLLTTSASNSSIPSLEHYQFDPLLALKNHYTYINQNYSALARVGDGTISPDGNSALHSTDNWLNSVVRFPHPFYDQNGTLWSDALIGQPGQTTMFYLVKFTTLDSCGGIGTVCNYSATSLLSNDLWQTHFNAGPTGWLIGDGRSPITGLGTSGIHKVPLTGMVVGSQVWLASGVGTDHTTDAYNPNKCDEPNVHYLAGSNMDVVTWTACRNIDDGFDNTYRDENVFAVDFN